MKRRDAQSVSDVLSMMMRAQGLETPLAELRAIKAWPEIVGERVASVSHDLKIYNQTLFVRIDSAPLRGNLFMQRDELVRKINDRAGASVVAHIVFR